MSPVSKLRYIFRRASSRAHARGAFPQMEGVFRGPGGAMGRYTVDRRGLTLSGPGAPGPVESRVARSRHGFRQVLIPHNWDGRRVAVFFSGAGAYAAGHPSLIAHLLSAQVVGAAVVWQDLHTNGFSLGRRYAVIRDVEELIAPQEALIDDVASLVGVQRPQVALLGFSLGGMVALEVARRQAPALVGVVAAAPFLRLAGKYGALKYTLAVRAINRAPVLGWRYIHRERFQGKARLEAADRWYSDDYQRRKCIDPFVDDSMVLSSLRSILRIMPSLIHGPPPEGIPVRIFHSTADTTCCYEASRDLAARWRAKGADVDFHAFDQVPHQLFHLKPEAWDARVPRIFVALRAIYAAAAVSDPPGADPTAAAGPAAPPDDARASRASRLATLTR